MRGSGKRFWWGWLAAVGTAAWCGAQVGPDVIVADLPSVAHWGAVTVNGELIRGYSVATTSCNIGDMDALWIASTNQHPVIAQHMYRLENGRLEQIGISWVKHSFATINNGICGNCNGHLGSVLGPGCSDPYSTGLNGGQSRLGPRSDINASTGVFPYPYTIGWQQTGNAIYKRCQVRDVDIDPAQHPDALWFIEGHYVTQDDASWGNQDNNASYRRVRVNSQTSISVRGTTQRQSPAIFAWQDHGLGVNQPDPDVVLRKIQVPNDGRFWVAAKATDLGNGMWHYEYAVQNISSDRSGGSFTVPLGPGVTVTNVGFHAPFYHSGEPYDNSPWTIDISATEVTWSSPESFAQNPNTNALRWGTLYNFWFDADSPPTDGDVVLGLFKPGGAGDPDSMSAAGVPVPAGSPCEGDLNGDNTVDLLDLSILLNVFGTSDPSGDLNGDGVVDLLDLSLLLNNFGTTCG